MFSGSIPALVTPFRDGSFDEQAFRRLVDWQIDSGSSALVPCGTTGEASTLSNAEHHRVIEVCVEQAAGRVPVIAGCGSNDTMNARLHMNFSRKTGAAAGAEAPTGPAESPMDSGDRKSGVAPLEGLAAWRKLPMRRERRSSPAAANRLGPPRLARDVIPAAPPTFADRLARW